MVLRMMEFWSMAFVISLLLMSDSEFDKSGDIYVR